MQLLELKNKIELQIRRLLYDIIHLEKKSETFLTDPKVFIENVRLRECSSRKVTKRDFSKNAIEKRIEKARKVYDLFSDIGYSKLQCQRRKSMTSYYATVM
jgi:hypothetical protein